MGKLGCNGDGDLNDQKFSAPMPWIGIYIAAASLACLLAMAADAFHGFRYKKFWFPCKFFSINATSLTLIGVAIKLSVDLNTPMPGRKDQLAKLSSAVLMCTVMGNSMPSLGTMGNEEIFMNIMALGILVITLIVNICIQLATGAIFVFWKEYAFVMLIMLVLLAMLSFSAVVVPSSKRYLEHKYNKKHELALKEAPNETNKIASVGKLRIDLMKYWMMAHTCSPQFVVGRSVICTASGAFCLVSAMILGQAILRSYLMPWSFSFCHGESDYRWSTTSILIIQTIAVVVGTIAPACRWLFAIRFRCPNTGKIMLERDFKIESYWTATLKEMKESPITSSIFKFSSRPSRRVAHNTKNMVLDLCIGVQTGIVILSKSTRFVSIFLVGMIWLCYICCRDVIKKFRLNNTISRNEFESDSKKVRNLDLGRFVLHLEGEDSLVQVMINKNCDATECWFGMGERRQPKHLTNLLEKSSRDFRGVGDFDSNQVPSLDLEDPPNCWALPVVTLTSIALALPNIDNCSVKQLVSGVNEGLIYMRHMEKRLDSKASMAKIKKAAEVVWTELDLYHRWLDVDLRKLSREGKNTKEILEELSQTARKRFFEIKNIQANACWKESPLKWPIKVLAANSMYRISQTILLNCECRTNLAAEKLFADITVMISDILGACMTNVEQVISVKCLCSTIEEREESVRHAVFVLGKTEKILKILEHREVPNLDPDERANIDKWRLLHAPNNCWSFTPSSSEAETPSPGLKDVYISGLE
ncbi:hypothetical protein UlMin_001304 [Ulmus minor]